MHLIGFSEQAQRDFARSYVSPEEMREEAYFESLRPLATIELAIDDNYSTINLVSENCYESDVPSFATLIDEFIERDSKYQPRSHTHEILALIITQVDYIKVHRPSLLKRLLLNNTVEHTLPAVVEKFFFNLEDITEDDVTAIKQFIASESAVIDSEKKDATASYLAAKAEKQSTGLLPKKLEIISIHR